ncbi:circadian clock protein KaiC [Palleronia aestuarii]|uniref:non-specific serine/threonine protein kinase n=1 Tax=Palleronia aestuarii TaxID=568105 RepID=A0A2W7PKY6_9RHOB|nr:ATPase domain-containing protein [Palleronia aestuarii]PZX09959.1 circadian clock protein KaiC [Palleronia aestuarii]
MTKSETPWGNDHAEIPEKSPLVRFPSGVQKLDQILGGGLVRGSSYIVQGPPGTGKTIMANQACFERVRSGERALYLTLLSESFTQMFAFLDGLDFFDRSRIPQGVYYSSVYATMRENGFDGVVRLFHDEIRKRAPSLVVLDGLYVAGEAINGDEHAFRRFITEISTQCAMVGTTLLMLTNADRGPSSPEYTMVDGWIELADDLLSDGRAHRTMVVHKHRGGPILRGRHDYVIRSGGLFVFPRLESIAPRSDPRDAPTNRMSLGVETLDLMTRGGLPQNSASVILGPTGSGKTTVGLQFLGLSTPEEPGLLVGFYEAPERLRYKASQMGVDLASLEASGAVKILWRRPLGNLVDEIGQGVVDAVENIGARRLVIDGMNALSRPLVSPSRLHAFLRAFNDILSANGVTTLYTREVPQLFFPEILGVDDMSGVIDNTFLFHYALDGDRVRRRATILKVRDSDFDHVSREFEITDNGLVFREPEGSSALQDMTTGRTSPDPLPSGENP